MAVGKHGDNGKMQKIVRFFKRYKINEIRNSTLNFLE